MNKRYEQIGFLGEGQFATVYKANDTFNKGKIVAVKKIKFGNKIDVDDGINRTALREINLLQELSHPNVIQLLDVFGHKSNVSLVFEYMDTDLEVIIKDQSKVLTIANIKSYLFMTLKGLEYLHTNRVLHRDLKPNNLLVDENGTLKIADFGLARYFSSIKRIFTPRVGTACYRAPELLFGARNYGTGVDMWAVGCILAELVLRVPFLPGNSEWNQLCTIFQTLGTPNEDVWPGLTALSGFELPDFPGTLLKDIFTAVPEDLLQVLENLFRFDPSSRPTCTQVLKLPFFDY